MRKRSRIALTLLLLAVIGGIGWVVTRPSEPVYEGKRLSEWLESNTSGNGDSKAYAAVVAAGTNAIPTLLRFMRSTDSPLKMKLLALAQKQHFIKFHHVGAKDRIFQSYSGFMALGDKGIVALPELIKIYEQNDPYAQFSIARLFGYFGPAASNAVPCLVRRLEVADAIPLETAIPALGRIHARPKLAVPALLKHINKKTPMLDPAVYAIGQFGADAKEAVPVLVGLPGDQDDIIRRIAANSLRQIDPEAAAKAGVK
ncbi:MAG: lyase domain protein repeat-containing protein [Pedosphaera sp.]|nr:lyase domain protein repeat-containing protein [Pedosphaera sp.]